MIRALLLFVMCITSLYAQQGIRGIKKEYKKALKSNKSYFTVDLEVDEKTFYDYVAKNKEIKLVGGLTGQETSLYGRAVIPVLQARFTIKAIRNKEIQKYCADKGFSLQTINGEDILVRGTLNNSFRNVSDLINGKGVVNNSSFAVIDWVHYLKEVSDKEIRYLTKEEVVKVYKGEYLYKVDERTTYAELYEKELKKAQSGTLADCIDFYYKYGGLIDKEEQLIPVSVFSRISYFLKTSEKLDDTSEKLKNQIFSLAYKKMTEEDRVLQTSQAYTFFESLTSTEVFYKAFDKNKFYQQEYNRLLSIKDELNNISSSKDSLDFVNRLVEKNFVQSFKNTFGDASGAQLAEEILDVYKVFNIIKQPFRKYYTLNRPNIFQVLYGIMTVPSTTHFEAIDADKKTISEGFALLEKDYGSIETNFLVNLKKALNEKEKKRKELENEAYSEARYTSAKFEKDVEKAENSTKRHRAEACAKCEIDYDNSKNRFPKDETDFFGFTNQNPGLFYMKNGDSYKFYSDSRGTWYISTGLFGSKDFRTIKEMLEYFTKKCRDNYCN